MSTFHITCTTCDSRLKVKDESAIGLILSCPKCGSMVMVAKPKGASVPSAADSAAAEVGQRETVRDSMQETVDGGFDLPDELLHPPTPPAPADRFAASDSSDVTAELGRVEDFAEPVVGDEDEPGDEPSGRGEDGDLEPILPDSQWISQETRQMRQWLLTGAGMVFGVLAAVGLVGYLIARQSHPPVAQGSPAPPAPQDIGPAPTDPKGTDPAATDPAPGEEPRPVEPAPVDPGPVEPAPLAPDPVELDPVGPAPADPGPVEPAPVEPAPVDPGPVEPAPVEPAPVEPAPPLTLDPPGLDPGGAEGILDDLKGELAEFESMLEEAEESRIMPSQEDPDRASAYDRLRAELTVVRRPRVLHIVAPQRMADPLQRVEIDGVALEQFLRFVTDLSTVPVTIDGDAMIQAGASPLSLVSCKLDEGNPEQLLRAALAPLGLAPQIGERHVRIVHRGGGLPVATQLPADDLAGSEQERAWLAQLIQDVVAPGTWKPDGAGQLAWTADRLAVKQSRPTLFEVLHLLESLRTARELPLQSKTPAEQYALGPRRTRAIPGLSKPTSVNFRDPAPLHKVLAELTEQSGIQFLIDWEAVEAERWNPLAEAALLTSEESLARALRSLLIPMDLDYYVVSADVIVITTPADVAARRELALYRVPDLVPEGNDVDLALEQLTTAIGPERFLPENGGALRFDAKSRTLIARLAPADHRLLQRILDQRRQSR